METDVCFGDVFQHDRPRRVLGDAGDVVIHERGPGLETLLDRRQMVAAYWLGKVDALSKFEIEKTGAGVALNFRDLLVDQGLVLAESTKYTYQVRGPRYKSQKQTVLRPEIRIDREMLSAAIEQGTDTPIEISIWPHRRVSNPDPVKIYFDWSPSRDQFTVRRISRG